MMFVFGFVEDWLCSLELRSHAGQRDVSSMATGQKVCLWRGAEGSTVPRTIKASSSTLLLLLLSSHPFSSSPPPLSPTTTTTSN